MSVGDIRDYSFKLDLYPKEEQGTKGETAVKRILSALIVPNVKSAGYTIPECFNAASLHPLHAWRYFSPDLFFDGDEIECRIDLTRSYI